MSGAVVQEPRLRATARPVIAVPPREALTGGDDDERDPRRAERATRRVLRASGALLLLAAVGAATVPLTRTVELGGQLVPERTVAVRASEGGLLDRVGVAAGDTVRPGAHVASLRSPELDEAFRLADPAASPWALLARRARLDVHAPPAVEQRADGTGDPATWWRGGVVLTEDLDERRGARLGAGGVVVELAALATDGRPDVPLVVRAWAAEREAQRVRAGMPARLTFSAVPQERPRQATGRVVRVGSAPDTGDDGTGLRQWRVEVEADPAALDAVIRPQNNGLPTQLRIGFSVEVAVEERRETLLRTATSWLAARRMEKRAATRPQP